MKLLILCLVIAFTTAFGEDFDLLAQQDECIKELDLDKTKFGKTPETNKDPFRTWFEAITKDYDGKCLFRCIMQKIGFINMKDEYQLENFKNAFKMKVDYDKCISIRKNDDCENVHAINMCILQQISS